MHNVTWWQFVDSYFPLWGLAGSHSVDCCANNVTCYLGLCMPCRPWCNMLHQTMYTVQTLIQHVTSDYVCRADPDSTCYIRLCMPCRPWCNMLHQTVYAVQTLVQHVTSDCVCRADPDSTCYIRLCMPCRP